ncbi:MAG: hypothetical protein NC324_09855 [Bacteroides sp.]|nr:hypothetical protein [Bacteroides sp.]
MMNTQEKLSLLQEKLQSSSPRITIMILGLGSVGGYLLDYLVSLADKRMRIVVCGRNEDKLIQEVNIVRTAATIRHQMRCEICVDGTCDLNDVESISRVLAKWQPDFIVNSSRVYAGLKYGSISWHTLRAYGIWTPLSIRFARNIMQGYRSSGCRAIAINTSYSDAVIPWLKSAGLDYFDFGSGNLNHLIPRMKFYLGNACKIDNYNDIDITLAVSHFHDVVISKEGQAEGQDILLDVKYKGKELPFDKDALLEACRIAMPVDQKRNMMNASSNFDIITSILDAIDQHKRVKFHTPGVAGEIGGYPYFVDTRDCMKAGIDTSVFSLEAMRAGNRKSIYKDGIENVTDGTLVYTDELLCKVKSAFGVELPKSVHLDEADEVGDFIIKSIIRPNIK